MVFKFRAINKRMIESLINAEVYFSLPKYLNDPFDCRIDIQKSLNNAFIRADGDGKENLELLRENFAEFFSKVQEDLETFGVWSCSLELKIHLYYSGCMPNIPSLEALGEDIDKIVGAKALYEALEF